MTKYVFLCLFFLNTLHAKDYFVSKSGNDLNEGSKTKPFLTIQKAINSLSPGDICYIRKGIYFEPIVIKSSGTKKKPITIKAYKNEQVILNGLQRVTGKWTHYKNNIYKTKIENDVTIEQLFNNDQMMFEARWPNITFDKIWDRNTWANAEKKSENGILYNQTLKNLNIDWKGSFAMLNVAHQFVTWSRPIVNFDTKASNFTYHLDVRLTTQNKKRWDDDKFYLFGHLLALDAPNEWYFDKKTRELYVYFDNLEQRNTAKISYKNIPIGMYASHKNHLIIDGISFFGTTFHFKNCNYITFQNSKLLYPTYARLLTDSYPTENQKDIVSTEISGNHNQIKNIGLAFSNTTGISIKGTYNTIENSIIHDINWVGALNYSGIRIWDNSNEANGNNKVKNCTIYNTGNTGIYFRGNHNIIEYNHIYNIGLACKDVAAIHTVNPECEGSIIKYNWIHDAPEKAIRGDHQSRKLTIHNNVIWNCGQGIICKGDAHKVYNNTVLGNDTNGVLLIPTRKEPFKWWSREPLLEKQNSNSVFYNNIVGKIEYRKTPLEEHQISNNYFINVKDAKNHFKNIDKKDFRLKKKSFFIDLGKNTPKYKYKGKQTDIGAYEYEDNYWKAGADWKFSKKTIEKRIRKIN